MTNLHTAAKLALEALESYTPGDYSTGHVIHPSCDEDAMIKAITALRQALAEPEQPAQQEPVVWMYVNKSTHETKFQKHMRDFVDHGLWAEVPLYGEPLANHVLNCVCGAVWEDDELVHPPRRPQAREPLTNEYINLLINGRGEEGDDDYVEPTGDGFCLTDADLVGLVRRAEAAHGITETKGTE